MRAIDRVDKCVAETCTVNQSPFQESRRRRREKEIKSEMLRAASDLFVALGHEHANMQLIAASAGVTKATLYAHFGSKDALFRTVIESWMDALPQPVIPTHVRGSLRSNLEKVAHALLLQSSHPASVALTHIMARSNWIPQKRWRQRYRAYQMCVEKALWQCARCNDPVRVARQFLLLAVGSLEPDSTDTIDEARITAAVELVCLAYE